jgi:hypothetical protein
MGSDQAHRDVWQAQRKELILDKSKRSAVDLYDYASEIRGADGQIPYNGYLWPSEQWWPGHSEEPSIRVPVQWHFGIIALDNGQFSIDGVVSHIEKNSDNIYEPSQGRKVVFATRRAAIRTAAARLIRKIRKSHYWATDRQWMVQIVNWILSRVAIATSHKTTVIEYRELPLKKTLWVGLPLFETEKTQES